MRPIFSKFAVLLALSVFILLSTHSCKKDGSKSTSGTSPFDITYTGNLWVYDTISFHSTAPATSTFLWKFGDGTTSTDSAPKHAYTSFKYDTTTNYNGTLINDTVTLIIDNDSLHPVIKALTVTPGAPRFAGTWHWTGGQNHFYIYGPPAFDSSYSISDTTFAITAADDSTIMAWGFPIPFSYKYNAFAVHYDPDIWLFVNKSNDTIFFTYSTGGLGGRDEVSYHTP